MLQILTAATRCLRDRGRLLDGIIWDSALIGAAIGACALVVGGLIQGGVTRLNARDSTDAQKGIAEMEKAKAATESAITSLTLLMESQAKRIDALEAAQAEIERKLIGEQKDHALTAKKKRILEEKLSGWISWHALVTMRWEGLKPRVDAAGVKYGQFPPLPPNLAVDLQSTPD